MMLPRVGFLVLRGERKRGGLVTTRLYQPSLPLLLLPLPPHLHLPGLITKKKKKINSWLSGVQHCDIKPILCTVSKKKLS